MPLGLYFTGMGFPCQNVDTVRQIVDGATTLLLEVFRQWNFVANFQCFLSSLCEKRKIWVSDPYFGKLGVTHDFGSWLVGKPMVNFLFALIDFFSLSITVLKLQLGCFRSGSTSLHSNFTRTGLSPSTILGTRKLDTLRYPMVKTASLCVHSFWHNTGVWRTDRRADGWTDSP